MTKLIPILSGRCLVVELPERATNLQLLTVHQGSKSFPSLKYDRPDLVRGFIDLPTGNWRIIGMLSEVTDEQAATFVKLHATIKKYKDYLTSKEHPTNVFTKTALESLESAILAEGWKFHNPYKKPDYIPKTMTAEFAYREEMDDWEKAESRVLCRERCLLLGREI